MKNGTNFLAFVEESVASLSEKTVIDYYAEPLLSETDDLVGNITDRFMTATAEQRQTFLDAFSQGKRSLFGIYGHRAATLAARQESRDYLLRGLVGSVIANYEIPDNRKVEVSLAVYHHCARRLEVNTVDLFEEAARFATDAFARILTDFGRRSDVSLKKYGWREVKTKEGIRYHFSIS